MNSEQILLDAQGRIVATCPLGTLTQSTTVVLERRPNERLLFNHAALAVVYTSGHRPLIYRLGPVGDHSLLFLPAESQQKDITRLGEVPAEQYRKQTTFTADKGTHLLVQCADRGAERVYMQGAERPVQVAPSCKVRCGDWFIMPEGSMDATRAQDCVNWPGPKPLETHHDATVFSFVGSVREQLASWDGYIGLKYFEAKKLHLAGSMQVQKARRAAKQAAFAAGPTKRVGKLVWSCEDTADAKNRYVLKDGPDYTEWSIAARVDVSGAVWRVCCAGERVGSFAFFSSATHMAEAKYKEALV